MALQVTQFTLISRQTFKRHTLVGNLKKSIVTILLHSVLPNSTWDSIANNLRQYNRSDTNAAMNIVCHYCHSLGHKSSNCPQRQKGGKGSGLDRWYIEGRQLQKRK